MRQMKRRMSVILLLSLLIGIFPTSINATETTEAAGNSSITIEDSNNLKTVMQSSTSQVLAENADTISDGELVLDDPTEYSTESQYVNASIEKIIDHLNLDNHPDWIKVLLIHDFVCEFVEYDWYGDTYSQSLYNTLTTGKTKCSGYSRLTKRLLEEAGISCQYISCDFFNHAWNAVELNGVWYNMDTTWDDTDDPHYGYGHAYFLRCDENFSHGRGQLPDEEYRGYSGLTMAETDFFCGRFGDDLYWIISEDHTLTVYGNGEEITSGVTNDTYGVIDDCRADDWVYHAIIPEGITTIDGGYDVYSDTYCIGFTGCDNLTDVYIPVSLTYIGKNSFSYCSKLLDVYYAGSEEQWNQISIASGNESLLNANIHYNWVAQPAISKFENTASGIKVTWDAVNGAAKYRVFVKTSSGWATIGTTTGTSLIWSGAKSGCTYTFTIRALNSAGTAFVSSYNTSGWKQQYVAQPAISKLENTATGVKITWNAVAGAGKYRVYVKTSTGWQNIGTTTGTSLTYTGAKSGYTYTFTVRALNSAGTAFVSSYNSTGWKQTYIAQPGITKLENTASGIKVTWNAVNGVGKYRLFVKTSKGWATIGTTTGTSLTYTGAKSGYTYTFTVRALNSAGTAFVSSYNTTGWKQTYIARPSITKLTNTNSGITVTWGAVNGAAKYRVFVKTSTGWKTIGTTTGTSLTWTGATKGVTYTFTVRCLNSAGTAFTSAFNSTGWSVKRT